MPDIKVGEHIDRDCKSDPAQRKRKVLTLTTLKYMLISQTANQTFFLFLERFLQISAPREAASRRR